ncbi:hypothetical protein EI555_009878, partial [Monodon monoceros]
PAVPAHAGRHRLRAWLAGALSSPAVRAAPWSSAERGSQGRRRLEEPDAAAGVAAGAAGAMTVEQNVLQQSAAQKHQQTFLNQLREITGINDAQILQQALKPYVDVIDLTGDDKDDLQRAIALSLAESNRAFRETGITDEEQAISRVLEASIAENKACLKRTPTEVWRDSRNPYDRKRQDKAPVGLKNVGNTCWFSAVIQSLFNLLEFRRLVLNYKPPSNVQDLPRNQKVKL